MLSLLKKIEAGDADVPKYLPCEDHGPVNQATGSGEGFWDNVLGGEVPEGAAKATSPFLEGVGDSDYDSDDDSEEYTFFSADMFPDANPVVDEITAKERQSEWQGQKAKPRFRFKHGKAVRK